MSVASPWCSRAGDRDRCLVALAPWIRRLERAGDGAVVRAEEIEEAALRPPEDAPVRQQCPLRPRRDGVRARRVAVLGLGGQGAALRIIMRVEVVDDLQFRSLLSMPPGVELALPLKVVDRKVPLLWVKWSLLHAALATGSVVEVAFKLIAAMMEGMARFACPGSGSLALARGRRGRGAVRAVARRVVVALRARSLRHV